MKKLLVLLLIAPFFIKATNPMDGGEEKMPSIVIKNLEGQDVDLQKLTSEGKITVISFWATWCSPCKKELDNLNELIGEWKDKYNMQIVAISIDDSRNAAKVKPYVQGKSWNFEVLIDVNQDTKRALNYPNVPYTLLIDQNGNIVYKHTGYTEGDEYVLEDKIKALQ